MIVLEDGKLYGFGNNQNNTIKPEGNEAWIGTPTLISVKKDGQGSDLKVLDACVMNCGHKRNAAIFLVEEPSEDGGTKQALYGSGNNITNCLGSDVVSNGSNTNGIKKLFKTYFGTFNGKIFNMWGVTSCNHTNDSSSYVFATFYCTAGASQKESILLASGYGKEGNISQSFDPSRNNGNTDTLLGCTLSNTGSTIKNVVQLQGTGYNGLVVIRDGNKHLYVAGNILNEMWNIPKGRTKGFIKATQGTGQYPVEASNFWLYGAINRASDSSKDDCKPYILYYHEGADPGFFHVGWDWASRQQSGGVHIVGGGNNYYSMLIGGDRIKHTKGVSLMSCTLSDYTNKGHALYGVSSDGRFLVYTGYPGSWCWWIDKERLGSDEGPLGITPVPGMALI